MQRPPASPCAERLLPRRAQAAAAARRALAGLSLRPRSASEACARAPAPSLATTSSGPGSALTPGSTPRGAASPGSARLAGACFGAGLGLRHSVGSLPVGAGLGFMGGPGGGRGEAAVREALLARSASEATPRGAAGAPELLPGGGAGEGAEGVRARVCCDGGAGALSGRCSESLRYCALCCERTQCQACETQSRAHVLCSAGPVPSCRWVGGRPAGSRLARTLWPLRPAAPALSAAGLAQPQRRARAGEEDATREARRAQPARARLAGRARQPGQPGQPGRPPQVPTPRLSLAAAPPALRPDLRRLRQASFPITAGLSYMHPQPRVPERACPVQLALIRSRV